MKNQFLFGLLLALFLVIIDADKPFTPRMNLFQSPIAHSRRLIEAKPEYTVKYYNQTIDHYTYASKNTFKMRYLENLQYWDKGNKGFFQFFDIKLAN